MKEPKEKPNYTSIGGQALIEGIMMRGPKRTAMAVRDPDGKIVLEIFFADPHKVLEFIDETHNGLLAQNI